MALITDLDEIRNVNPDLLQTDGITDTQITRVRDNIEIKVLNEIAHAYKTTDWTAATVPSEVKQAIIEWAAGQTIINHYSDDKDLIKLGQDYRRDAKDLLKNIVEGKRRLENETKAASAATVANSIVYDTTDVIDERITDLLTDIDNGYYDY